MTERRQYRRIETKKKIKFGVDVTGNLGYLIDVSMFGARVATKYPLPAGTKIKLEIEGANNEIIKAQGHIQWSKSPAPEDKKHDLGLMGINISWRDGNFLPFLSYLIEERRTKGVIPGEHIIDIQKGERVEYIFEETHEILKQYKETISRGGIFIPTEHPKPKGTLVSLRLIIPQILEDVLVEGKVTFSIDVPTAGKTKRPPGMGIAFIKFAEGDKEKLFDFLEKLKTAAKSIGIQ